MGAINNYRGVTGVNWDHPGQTEVCCGHSTTEAHAGCSSVSKQVVRLQAIDSRSRYQFFNIWIEIRHSVSLGGLSSVCTILSSLLDRDSEGCNVPYSRDSDVIGITIIVIVLVNYCCNNAA